MRARITKKNVLAQFKTILEADSSFKDFMDEIGCTTDFYTAGIYGWNADVYDLGDGIALVAGYRPFGNAKVSSRCIEGLRPMLRNMSSDNAREFIRSIFKVVEDDYRANACA